MKMKTRLQNIATKFCLTSHQDISIYAASYNPSFTLVLPFAFPIFLFLFLTFTFVFTSERGQALPRRMPLYWLIYLFPFIFHFFLLLLPVSPSSRSPRRINSSHLYLLSDSCSVTSTTCILSSPRPWIPSPPWSFSSPWQLNPQHPPYNIFFTSTLYILKQS